MRIIAAILMVCALWLSVSSATAQTQQETAGPCGNAIAHVKGNVTVTCTFNGKAVKIAHFKGALKGGMRKFSEFTEANENKIVYVDLDFDLSEYNTGLNCEEFLKSGKDICVETVGDGPDGTFVDMRDAQHILNNRCGFQCSPCSHGTCNVKGFFVAEDTGVQQGWWFIRLHQLESDKVLLSPNINQ